jgi:hypothetical protein
MAILYGTMQNGQLVAVEADSQGRLVAQLANPVDPSDFVAITGSTMTGNLTVPSLNGGPLAGFRNQIINGGFNVFQRATGSAVVVSSTSSQYVLDRWNVRSNVGAAATTITVRDLATSDHPPGCWKAMRLENATATASPTSTQFVGFQQKLEQDTTRALGFGSPLNAPISVGFWIRSSVAATYTFSVQCEGSVRRSYLFDFTVPADTTNWTYVSHSFTTDSSIGFLDNASGTGAIVSIYLASGSNFVGGTNEAWNGGELFMTSAASNNFTTTAGAFVDITGLQLEPGPVATPFEHRPIGTELALCQRYYQKHNSVVDGYSYGFGGFGGTAGIENYCAIQLPVTMRVSPTVTSTAPSSSGCNGWGLAGSTSPRGFTYYTDSDGAFQWYTYADYTADAEL